MPKKPGKPRRTTPPLAALAAKEQRRKKQRVSIIGAGRLGTALGLALKNAGYRVEVVVAEHTAGARRAAKLIGPGTLAQTWRQLEGESEHLRRSDLILIATPDDAIALVARQLSTLFKSKPLQDPERNSSSSRLVAMHASGALSSEVLQPLRSTGFAVGSLHPLVSISSPTSGAKGFRNAFFCVEGDRPATRVARAIVRDLGGHSFTIDPHSKALYHAAAVTASGQMVALFDIALEMLARCGLSNGRARKVLMPLMESNLANLSTSDPSQSLTGTFARGDMEIVKKHIAAMKKQGLHQALAAYILLGQRSLALAKQRNPNHSDYDRIARLLAKTAKSID